VDRSRNNLSQKEGRNDPKHGNRHTDQDGERPPETFTKEEDIGDRKEGDSQREQGLTYRQKKNSRDEAKIKGNEGVGLVFYYKVGQIGTPPGAPKGGSSVLPGVWKEGRKKKR